MKTYTPEIKQSFERLSKSALCSGEHDTTCEVSRNDLSSMLLAYQLELGNNQDKEKEFAVIAGKYDSAFDDGENIKVALDELTFVEALEKAADLNSYPFCYIVYKEHRLNLS